MNPAAHRSASRPAAPPWDKSAWIVFSSMSGVVALLALGAAVLWPRFAALIGFLGATILINGPFSPLFPASYEPVLMLAARIYPPLVIAVVGTAGILYMEFINYHLYGFAVLHPRLERARGSFWVRQSEKLFRRSPFFAVWLLAFTPLPYWVARILGPLTAYPKRRYLLATFLGRFPRLWLYAAFSLWLPIPTRIMLLGTLAITGIAFAVAVVQRRQRRRSADPGPAQDPLCQHE